jgi:hypothetical protein
MTPPIPTHLRIGHLLYTITVDDDVVNAEGVKDNANYAGFSHSVRQLIALRADNPPDYQAETLLHEMLHQCLRVTGVDPDADAKAGVADVEERAIKALAGPLLRTLRDHPGLVAYLVGQEPADDGIRVEHHVDTKDARALADHLRVLAAERPAR